MKGEFEKLASVIGIMVVMMWFLPTIMDNLSNDNFQVEDKYSGCELEWVECTDDDMVGDCEEHHEESVVGPYWDETTETKITLRKQICKE